MIWPRFSLLLYVVSQTEKEKKDDEYLKHCEIKVVVANRPQCTNLGQSCLADGLRLTLLKDSQEPYDSFTIRTFGIVQMSVQDRCI